MSLILAYSLKKMYYAFQHTTPWYMCMCICVLEFLLYIF